MKTKRIAALLLALLLLLTASACPAESIFELLPEDETETAPLTAPSYGAMANVAEDQVEQNAEGGTIVTYRNVPAAGINRFGEYLGRLGYAVTSKEKQQDKLAYAVSNGQVSFVMIYDQATKTLQLIYPQGTDYEKSAFPGYAQAEPGQELTIPGLGTFVFTDLVLNGNGYVCGFAEVYEKGGKTFLYNEKGNSYHRNIQSWMLFSYYNTANTAKEFSQTGNDLFTAELVYLTGENQYSFSMKETGRFLEGKNIISTSPRSGSGDYTIIENPPCNPLDRLNGAVAFDLPEGLRESSEGTIALKLDFKTGEKYAVIFR